MNCTLTIQRLWVAHSLDEERRVAHRCFCQQGLPLSNAKTINIIAVPTASPLRAVYTTSTFVHGVAIFLSTSSLTVRKKSVEAHWSPRGSGGVDFFFVFLGGVLSRCMGVVV